MKNIPQVYFYMPKQEMLAGDVPEDADINWSDFMDCMRKPGVGSKFIIGSYCWILQTFLYLRQAGFSCKITTNIPDEGIIIGQRAALPFNLKPKQNQLIICIKADCEVHHYAHLHIVQNPQEEKEFKDAFFIPLWPQPGLIPRNQSRENKFENIAFYGVSASLAPELINPNWAAQLESMGLNWQIVGEERWHDYSDTDAVIAVRSFAQKQGYNHKPATKLYNAWLADVPAILGIDSAFRAERQSELDYLEITSIDEAIAALQRLRDNSELYQAMIKNGQARAEKFKVKSLIQKWEEFFNDVAFPAYYRWCKLSSLQQKLWLAKQQLIVTENNLRPNPYYPYELDPVNNDHIGIQDSVLISTLELYRKMKRLVTR